MADKPKVSPGDTYVLDDEDIERLDDLTLTSVIRDASDLPEPDPDPTEESSLKVDDLEFDILTSKE